nr:MAG TPA: RNA polymerase sigma factor [Caudoviricetes sp.]
MEKDKNEKIIEVIFAERTSIEKRVAARSGCRSREMVEDAVQEAIFKYWQLLNVGKKVFKSVKDSTNQIVCWAKNRVIDFQNKEVRDFIAPPPDKETISMCSETYISPVRPKWLDQDLPCVENVADTSPFEDTKKRDFEQSLQRLASEVLSIAPAKGRDVAVAYYSQLDCSRDGKVSTQQVAEVCNISPRGVRSALGRIRDRVNRRNPSLYKEYARLTSV